MAWRCFFLEPVELVRVELRRYTHSAARACSATGYGCDATVTIEDRPAAMDHEHLTGPDPEFPPEDWRWPADCEACGKRFAEDDPYQVWHRRLYRPIGDPLPPDMGRGARFTLDGAPIGAMWDADWLGEFHRGPDGRCLVVRCPGRWDWVVDGPASNGPGWSRHGDPPDVTARPSIGVGAGAISARGYWYHGWLTDGVLSDPLPDSRMLTEGA